MKSVRGILFLLISLMGAVSFIGCSAEGDYENVCSPSIPDKDESDRNKDIKNIPIKNKRPDLGPIRPRVDFSVEPCYNVDNMLIVRLSAGVTSAELHLHNIATGDYIVLKDDIGMGEICCEVERGMEYLLTVVVDGDIYEEMIFVR